MDSCPADDSDSLKPKSHCPNDVMESNKDPKVDYCGIGLWRPSCLEPLRDIRAFIAAMCFVSCLQASYSGYTSSQITTLEKRFAVGSIVIGSINSFFEVGYISCVMIVSYLGSMGRVPLWISCGLFAMSCGAFLFSVPQFLFPYNTSFSSGKSEHLCPKNIENNLSVAEETPCRSQAGGAYQFLPILLCAQFLIGAGSSPILTLAPPFVDDHVPPSKAPGMIASLYAAAALGPVFGYALGAFMLQHPMDKWSKTKILSAALTPASEDWIGLWWAGYIVLGFGVFLGACILIMFPRNLRSSFTSHKRSFENNRAGCSGVGIQSVDVELNDTNLHNLSRNTTPVAEASHPFPLHLQSSQVIHQSYRQRATSQYHHRSFSGNAPFTSTPTNIPAPVTGGTRPSIFFPTARSRHQRSASVSSILLHAAILAATASHAAEEEDEVAPTETDLSESASESDSSSPEESKRQNKWQNRLNQMTNDSQRPTHAVRSSIGRSLSLSAWQQRRWVSPSWLSRSSSSGVTQSVGGFRRRFRTPNSLGVSPPTLDVMLEDCTPEASTNPIKNLANETSDRNEFDFDVKATPIRKSQGGPKRSHPPILEGDSNQSPNSSSNPISTSSLTKPSILVHFHSHRRRRRRKIIRGRIFGFLADWSKDIPKSIFALLKNEIYVVTCLCICCEMFIVIGFAGFLPKYMEIEYQISKTTASMIAGGLIVPSGAFGILAGGLILNKARLSRKGSVIFVLCVNFVIVSCMCSFFFLGCENPKIAGLTVPYPVAPNSIKYSNPSRLVEPWNMECCKFCGCNPTVWKPVCHVKSNTIFFSACFAGCTDGPTLLQGSNQYVYHNCHCLSSFAAGPNSVNVSLRDNLSTAHQPTQAPQVYDDEVIAGVCAPGCKTLIPFICFLTVLLFLTGVIQNPLLIVTMRSVRHNQRSLALGLQFVIIRLLANLPSPIAFGRAIDGACVLWKVDCGRRGDCAFMDLKNLTYYITGLGVSVKGSSVLIYLVLIYLLSRRSTGSSASAGDEIAKFNAADPSAVSLRDGDSSLPTSLPQRRPSLNLVVADIRDST